MSGQKFISLFKSDINSTLWIVYSNEFCYIIDKYRNNNNFKPENHRLNYPEISVFCAFPCQISFEFVDVSYALAADPSNSLFQLSKDYPRF